MHSQPVRSTKTTADGPIDLHSPQLSCIVCNVGLCAHLASYNNSLYSQTDLFSSLDIYRCNQCAFVFAYPQLPSEVLSEFYRSQYRASGHAHAQQLISHQEHSKYGLRGLAQLQLVTPFLEHECIRKIMDAGAGPGATLRVAKRLFPKAGLYALEPDTNSHSLLKEIGCEVFPWTLNLDTPNQIKDRFDLIVLSHVLEHYNFSDLPTILSVLEQLLAPGGLLVLEVPYEGLDKQGIAFFANMAPHLCFFNTYALRSLLDRFFTVYFCQSCGPVFKPSAAKPPSFPSQPKSPSNFRERLNVAFKKAVKNMPLFKDVLAIRRKLQLPDAWTLATHENYHYGDGRLTIRAVVGKKPEAN